MSVIALFLAIAIFYEMIIKSRKEKQEKEQNNKENTLNIKEDSNITYEDLSKDEEVRRAKEELEKVKHQLLIKEQEERERKEIERIEKKKEISDSRIENIVNKKLETNNIDIIDNQKEERVKLDKELLDKEIENIVNKKLESISKENVEKTSIKVENKEVNKNIDNKNIDVSKYNKLLSEDNKNTTNVTNEKEKTKEETYEEDIEKISDSTKEKIIDEYLKKFYKESRNSNNSVVKIKDNTQIDKEKEIKELQNNINSDFKDNSSLFDEDEEDNAIISYDELKKAASFGYTDEEMNKYEDEKDAIISIDELEKLYKEINNIKDDTKSINSYKEDFIIPSNEYKTVRDLPEISSEKIFRKSDIISPIYGVRELDNKTKLDTLTKLNEEIKRTNEFLRMLKELKKNLQ